MAKNQIKSKQHPKAELLLFEKYSLSSSMLLSKVNLKYSEKTNKSAKNKFDSFNGIIWSIIMKMGVKMKNRSYRYIIKKTKSRHGYKYTKYQVCLSIMMVMCDKQHISNIWN